MTIRRLDEKQVKYIIRERKKNTKSSVIAKRMNVTTRRVNQIYAHYVKTGSAPIARRIGRPKIEPTQKEIKIVTETYKQKPLGVVRLTKYLHTLGIQISYSTVQKIMIAKGLVSPSPAKRKRRKWIRYERKYSNAMWHVDWHIIKDSRWRNLYLICYLDDASRCITGFGVYQNATASEYSIKLSRHQVSHFDDIDEFIHYYNVMLISISNASILFTIARAALLVISFIIASMLCTVSYSYMSCIDIIQF